MRTDADPILPLGDPLDPARPELFASEDALWPLFQRLRDERPVHFFESPRYGPYWAVTRWADIMAVDTDHRTYSSASGISMLDSDVTNQHAMPRQSDASFIEMDPPRHDAQRKIVSPAIVGPNLANLAPLIRERAARILDGLPIGEKFDWVDKVSIELTAMTLATLFDFPQEDRRLLPYWSDIFTSNPGQGPVTSMEQKFEEMGKCFTRFLGIWNERVNAPPQPDLISMLAHGEATRNMAPTEFFGNVSLLIVGGNDTTRNSISASVHALSQFPDQEAKLRANPDLIPGMVSETIRWHTPVAHMKRTATCDAELGGQKIKQGDRVVMWYVSGNRDEREIPEADKFQIDRPNVRHHMAFGFGIHRCVGNRLAELQLKIVWEEILKRFPRIEALSEPVRAENIFLRSIEHLDVLIPERY